jgi:hypothetical protein
MSANVEIVDRYGAAAYEAGPYTQQSIELLSSPNSCGGISRT